MGLSISGPTDIGNSSPKVCEENRMMMHATLQLTLDITLKALDLISVLCPKMGFCNGIRYRQNSCNRNRCLPSELSHRKGFPHWCMFTLVTAWLIAPSSSWPETNSCLDVMLSTLPETPEIVVYSIEKCCLGTQLSNSELVTQCMESPLE